MTIRRWQLQVVKGVPPDEIDTSWQSQYTGYDPGIDLPSAWTEGDATEFLRAYASFYDKIAPLNQGEYAHRPITKLTSVLKKKVEDGSNSAAGIYKRAWFNNSILDDKPRARWIDYWDSHLFTLEPFSSQIPPYSPRYGGTKYERIARGKLIEEIKRPYKRRSEEKGFDYQLRVEKALENMGLVENRNFIQWLAWSMKPQYIEPWLLYTGHTLGELEMFCEMNVNDLIPFINQIKVAYHESGYQKACEKLRGLTTQVTEIRVKEEAIIGNRACWRGSIKTP